MFRRDLHPRDLLNLVEWQSIQDSLSEVLEVALKTFSPDGKALSKTSRPNRLYNEILPKASRRSEFCASFLFDAKAKNIKDITKDTTFKCPFGVDIFVVPIKAVGDRIIAYLVLGPIILKGRKNISEYAKEAENFGISLEELTDALIEINVFSYSKVNAIIKLIKDMFSHMARTEYHKRRLGEIRPEVIELDPLFSRYYEEHILNALLNSCTVALNADSGSIMTVDKNTNVLHIKVASRMDKDVVDNTEIKVGEGIAGIAAATSEPIILPKDKDKSGLYGKMKREYIKSSLIVPFNKGNTPDVYGVINLNIVRRDKELSESDIAFVKELVNMASIALIPLSQTDADLNFV